MAQDADWMARWMRSVASGAATMSQRNLRSVEAHGGIAAAIRMARDHGVHLARLVDDRGETLVTASRHPIETLC